MSNKGFRDELRGLYHSSSVPSNLSFKVFLKIHYIRIHVWAFSGYVYTFETSLLQRKSNYQQQSKVSLGVFTKLNNISWSNTRYISYTSSYIQNISSAWKIWYFILWNHRDIQFLYLKKLQLLPSPYKLRVVHFYNSLIVSVLKISDDEFLYRPTFALLIKK